MACRPGVFACGLHIFFKSQLNYWLLFENHDVSCVNQNCLSKAHVSTWQHLALTGQNLLLNPLLFQFTSRIHLNSGQYCT